MKTIVFFVSILMSLPSFAATKYKIDTAHSSVEFSIKHLGLFPVKGKFKKFEGSFTFDETTGMAENINLKIDVDSIDTNNSDRDAHLKSKDFFNVRDDEYEINKKYRYITFNTKKASLTDKSIAGKMKILKTRKKVTFEADINSIKEGNAYKKIGISATSKINRKKFGLTWQKPTTGIVSKTAGKFVGEEVKIIVNILAVPDQEGQKLSSK